MIAESVSLQMSRIHSMAFNKCILYSLDMSLSTETSRPWCNWRRLNLFLTEATVPASKGWHKDVVFAGKSSALVWVRVGRVVETQWHEALSANNKTFLSHVCKIWISESLSHWKNSIVVVRAFFECPYTTPKSLIGMFRKQCGLTARLTTNRGKFFMPGLLVHTKNVNRILFFSDSKLDGNRLSISVTFCNTKQIRHSSIRREVNANMKLLVQTGVARCNPHNLRHFVRRAPYRLLICFEVWIFAATFCCIHYWDILN